MLGRLGMLAIVVAVATGCSNGCPDGSKSVSLDGEFTCGEATCAAGQLCIPWPASADGSVFSHECVDVPRNCPVCECGGHPNCTAACLAALCPGGSDVAATRGRILDCPYPQ
jgi:hypothetical protein